MAIINDIDCGVYAPWNAPAQTWVGPAWGQVSKAVAVEGAQEIVYPSGGKAATRTETIWLIPTGAIGGSIAGSQNAVIYLLRQLMELSANRALQPCFIQWRSGGGIIVPDTEDGWYIITDIKPDMEFIWTGIIPVVITAIYIGPYAPNRIGMGWAGGAFADNFSGGVANLIALPFGSTSLETGLAFNRVGAEGNIPCVINPVANPTPLVPPAVIANLFKGGVRCYDTVNTGSNPIPSTTFLNPNWIEVKGVNHKFLGDCVITNGLAMIVLKAGNACSLYVWTIAIATPAWIHWGDIGYIDSAGNVGGNIQAYSLMQVGLEKCSATGVFNTGAGLAVYTFQLKRGHYEIQVSYKSLTDAGSANAGPIIINLIVNGPKIAFNSTSVSDNVNPPAEVAPGPASDYGYGAGFINDVLYPFIFGILYQNQPTQKQPNTYGATNKDISTGDSGVGIGSERLYAIFAVPYGVLGTYTPVNLQSEAESGTLAGGWAAQANAAASGGNEIRIPTASVAGGIAIWGTAFLPALGTYDVWMRIKVTATGASSLEMTAGLWDNTAGAYYAGGSVTLNRNAMSTGYIWVKVGSVTITGTNQVRFRAITALTLTTDWFIDEAVLLPKTITGDKTGPQDLWSQFAYQTDPRLVRQ